MGNQNIKGFTVVQALGHQMILQSGYWYDVNSITAKPKDIIKLNRVLLHFKDDEFTVGYPCISKKSVLAQVLQHFRGKKTCVFKYKPKKKYTRKKGYRSSLTRILVKKIFE